jgi:hypothetical protein
MSTAELHERVCVPFSHRTAKGLVRLLNTSPAQRLGGSGVDRLVGGGALAAVLQPAGCTPGRLVSSSSERLTTRER